ncbi:nucleoside triphosphate pyrophosphohydrolase [Vineibacter terrae]|uniref:nucleoside triphosphate pyrophosphohydrolase n=1 Tax=Vineibacter terrae TaxID=2586908 RepID=UPI002E332A5B|nr:nucleoside triphosphate pyrophosphohydrolase [Vineibacter terrae]HEX2891917.1 nucleoside triphosphate pyrophosphohydrolase [Vineibacter terrae]
MPSDKPTPDSLPREPLERLLAVMAWLRHPVHGCPWDLKQDFASIAPYTLEEAYEVADAIRRGDRSDLREELGDLLLQVVYHARMAEEEGAFAFRDVAQAIADKMVNRHPHVFGDAHVEGDEHQSGVWEQIKAQERGARQAATSVLDGVALALPSLVRAEKLQKRAARVGFDWGAAGPVIDKIEEEIGELRAEVAAKAPAARLQDEIGDVLFAVANLARHLKIDPEAALRATNEKFDRRFRHVERRLHEAGRSPEQASLDEMEALWQEAKATE